MISCIPTFWRRVIQNCICNWKFCHFRSPNLHQSMDLVYLITSLDNIQPLSAIGSRDKGSFLSTTDVDPSKSNSNVHHSRVSTLSNFNTYPVTSQRLCSPVNIERRRCESIATAIHTGSIYIRIVLWKPHTNSTKQFISPNPSHRQITSEQITERPTPGTWGGTVSRVCAATSPAHASLNHLCLKATHQEPCWSVPREGR